MRFTIILLSSAVYRRLTAADALPARPAGGFAVVVQEVRELAQKSASAAKEINSAVNQMDQVTQQNTAMVEETTAASVTLNDEAQTLKALVARFRTSHDTQDNAEALLAATQRMRAPAPARHAPSTLPARKARPQTQGANALARDDWEEF